MTEIRTQNGYDLGAVISALQKTIRRGDEEQAMYWSLELIPTFEKYLWRRLIVIVNEDIGIANTQLLMLVPIQEQQYMQFRVEGKDGSARLCLSNTILAMCRSEKCRVADHFQCAVLQDKLHSPRLAIPDYAYDKHTLQGKRMGRGLDHWIKEGCQLDRIADIANPYIEKAHKWWASSLFTKVSWGKRGKKGKYQQTDIFSPVMEDNANVEDLE
jgi:replication-associated recombination protein RarA